MKHMKKVSKTAPSRAQIWTWPAQLAAGKQGWLCDEGRFDPTLNQIEEYIKMIDT
jgi:hypothetical protein